MFARRTRAVFARVEEAPVDRALDDTALRSVPSPEAGRSSDDSSDTAAIAALVEPTALPLSGGRRNALIGTAITIVMAVMFAAGTVLLKSMLQGSQNAYVILTVRFALSAGLICVFIAATGRPLLPERGEWLGIAVAGTIGYGTEAAFFSGALNHGHVGTVEFLFYTYPVIVMVATIVIDRRPPAGLLVFALGSAVIGSAIVILGGNGVEIQPIGIVLILLCAAGYSGYLIGLDRVVKRTDLLTSVMWLAVGAGVANAVFALTFGNNVMPHGMQWLRVLGMAALTAGAFVCLLASLRRIGALRNSIIGVVEPLVVALLGAAFLAESISSSTAIGGSLILAGAVAAAIARSKKPTGA